MTRTPSAATRDEDTAAPVVDLAQRRAHRLPRPQALHITPELLAALAAPGTDPR